MCMATLPPGIRRIQLCLLGSCYHIGKQVMDDMPVYGVEPKITHLAELDFLTYFYYGGMINIGLKNFAGAMTSFKMAITMPAAGESTDDGRLPSDL